jgi:SulP family sulfate permease
MRTGGAGRGQHRLVPLFGGFCVTGTIARTATNVRAGSRGPVSGMLHALFVLAFMAVAAPLAAYIPLAALAGVLAVVSWGMIEKAEIWALVRGSRGDALIVLTTFLLVVFRDLTEGIVVGFALAGLVFIKRMSEGTELDTACRPKARCSATACWSIPARPVLLWRGGADRRRCWIACRPRAPLPSTLPMCR